ncbi:hypothetical protein D3C87_1616230 [compost metagenome]
MPNLLNTSAQLMFGVSLENASMLNLLYIFCGSRISVGKKDASASLFSSANTAAAFLAASTLFCPEAIRISVIYLI